MDKIREWLKSIVEKGERTRERTAYDLNPKASTWYDYGAEWVAGEVLDMLDHIPDTRTVYVPIAPKNLRREIDRILQGPSIVSPAEHLTVTHLVRNGMSKEEAWYATGAAQAVKWMRDAIDRDCERTVESRKKQLIHQLEDLGMAFDLCSHYKDDPLVQASGWPKEKDGKENYDTNKMR